ncbi:hypothetical protein K1719_021282 [Acacia pycnantha]|nr:hypothetical protein K1719_021282 [Acacia pycnantha]
MSSCLSLHSEKSLRHNQNKIRKRANCSSSSSSSLLRRKYRFKRSILVANKGGSSTPFRCGKLARRRPLLPPPPIILLNSLTPYLLLLA